MQDRPEMIRSITLERPWRSRLFADPFFGGWFPSQVCFVGALLFLRIGIAGWATIVVLFALAVCAATGTYSVAGPNLVGRVLGVKVIEVDLRGAEASIVMEMLPRGAKGPVIHIENCSLQQSWLPGAKIRWKGDRDLGIDSSSTVVLGYSRGMTLSEHDRWMDVIVPACGGRRGRSFPGDAQG
jgi:hypothetical protein